MQLKPMKSESKSSTNKAVRGPPQYARRCKLTFDLLTLKVVPSSHVWRGLYICANFSK